MKWELTTSFSITLAVRRWIAAQIQWKIEAPHKNGNKVVPPVENAPDDAEARRAEIHAGSRTEREDSEDEDRPYGPWVQPRNLKEESPPSPPTECPVPSQTTTRTTRARAAQRVEGSQSTSAARSKKRKRQVSTSNLMEESLPSTPVEHPVPLRTAIPRPTRARAVQQVECSESLSAARSPSIERPVSLRSTTPRIAIPRTTRARAEQQVESSQPMSAARSKKIRRQGPSTNRSNASRLSTSRSQHEDNSQQHTPMHIPDTAIDSCVAPGPEGPPTEVVEMISSKSTNDDRVRYCSRVEMIADNPPSIPSFQSEASSSQQGEEAVLHEPSPTPSDEVIFMREVQIVPLPMPAPEPLRRLTIPSMLASPVLNPPRNPCVFANPQCQRPASHPTVSQPPPSNTKFPPGSSKVPRRCSQCDHSLDERIDIMTDSGGFAQWKKKCIYCRREVGRSKPCTCYRCQLRKQEDINELPTQATPSTGHVDLPNQAISSTDPTSAPVAGQLRTMDNDGSFLHGRPLTLLLDEPTRDTSYRSMAYNGPASIADASQQVATTDRGIIPTTYLAPGFNPSDLSYRLDSNAQQNTVAGHATYATYRPNAPINPAPAPSEAHDVDMLSSSARPSVSSPHVNPSYLPTPALSSRSNSVVSTGNTIWSSPVIPTDLITLSDADWVIEEQPELTKAIRQIQQHWGSGWRAKLQAGGVYIDIRPNEELAKSLARLSAFERDLVTLLNSL